MLALWRYHALLPETPASLGFSMPAEWETHEATWLAWPHHPTDWPGKLDTIRWVYGEMVRKIAPGETVRMLVNSSEGRDAGAPLSDPRGRGRTPRGVHRASDQSRLDAGQRPHLRPPLESTNRSKPPSCISISTRGPSIRTGGRIAACRKPRRVISASTCSMHNSNGRPFVLEGGGIEVNGHGTLITTEECYLAAKIQVRNPGLGRKAFETALRENLGVTNIFWLARRRRGRRYARPCR